MFIRCPKVPVGAFSDSHRGSEGSKKEAGDHLKVIRSCLFDSDDHPKVIRSCLTTTSDRSRRDFYLILVPGVTLRDVFADSWDLFWVPLFTLRDVIEGSLVIRGDGFATCL